MWESLIELDYALFALINQTLSFDFLDRIMPLWRSKYFWIPLYIFLIVLIAQTFRKKSGWIYLGIALTIFLADTVSSKIIKKNVKRLRPCRTEILKPDIEVLVHCGSGYSFTSSHATNHFAIATFLFITLGLYFKKIRWWLLVWAGTIAYGQVYVGVHFPFDVFVGSLLGVLIGMLVGFFIKPRIQPAS